MGPLTAQVITPDGRDSNVVAVTTYPSTCFT